MVDVNGPRTRVALTAVPTQYALDAVPSHYRTTEAGGEYSGYSVHYNDSCAHLPRSFLRIARYYKNADRRRNYELQSVLDSVAAPQQ